MPSSADFSPCSSNRKTVIVRACKFDDSLHRAWECALLDENDDYWLFVGVFEEEIKHPLIGVIRPGTVSYEYYWKRDWYNVFRFHEPDGALKCFYCNVNSPPVLSDSILTYVDLDLDVLAAPDLSYRILDTDEFAENSRKYGYPIEIVERAQAALAKIVTLIETKQFPFDYAANEL